MTSTKSASPEIIIYLLRNDLRVHDNECFHFAAQRAAILMKNPSRIGKMPLRLVPVYCFHDIHYFTGTYHYGFSRVGEPRARFIMEAVRDLKKQLQIRGSDLIVRSCFAKKAHGNPVKAVQIILEQLGITGEKNSSSPNCTLIFQEEVTQEEVDVESSLIKLCKEYGVKAKKFWGATLYHIDDLGMFRKVVNSKSNPPDVPDVFSPFRRAVESKGKVRSPFPTPVALPPLPDGVVSDELPNDTQIFNASKSEANLRGISARISAFPFKGGETCALKRLEDYLWKTKAIATYKETRNGMVGTEYSTKLSPWLAIGNLSPRTIYAEVKKFEFSHTANISTYWVVFELIWRDWFRYICFKYGNKVFFAGGIRGLKVKWNQDLNLFERWKKGTTGVPFVDANMRELLKTGWMSNRGRQNVASFLVKDLKLDWRLGAEWFESMLLDHDVCSNYGNWNHAAGIGSDPRDRKFNVIKQGLDYDPNGEYVKQWVPELAKLAKQASPGKIHFPWKVWRKDLRMAGVKLGETYPKPVVIEREWKNYYSTIVDNQGRALKSRGQSKQRRGVDFYFQ